MLTAFMWLLSFFRHYVTLEPSAAQKGLYYLTVRSWTGKGRYTEVFSAEALQELARVTRANPDHEIVFVEIGLDGVKANYVMPEYARKEARPLFEAIHDGSYFRDERIQIRWKRWR